MRLSPLTPYMVWIKVGAILAFGLGCYVYGGSNAKARCERAALAKENKALTAAVAERDRAIAERNEAQRKADRLDKPQREVAKSAKANPSGCDLAKPTADSLREQANATNAAIP